MRKLGIGALRGTAAVFAALVFLAGSAVGAWGAVVREMDGAEKTVYLTFDDGPDEINTQRVMEILMEYNAEGTFFFTGVNMERYPQVVRRAYDNGFTIGLHGYAHSSLLKMSAAGVVNDINAANDALESITGERSAIVRPPYGVYSGETIKALDSIGFTAYMWTIDPKDWSSASTDASTIENIMQNLKPGAIILLHSSVGHDRAARILPRLIEYIRAEGYQIKALPDNGFISEAALKSQWDIYVNGRRAALDSYIINGSNYVGLRGLAAALAKTESLFDFGWDENRKAITLEPGAPYLGEAPQPAPGNRSARARPVSGAVVSKGEETAISAYLINGASFFNLREMAAALGAELIFDSDKGFVNIATSGGSALDKMPMRFSGSAFSGAGRRLSLAMEGIERPKLVSVAAIASYFFGLI